MDYILDTNIILTYIRKSKYTDLVDSIYNPLGKENTAIVSVVSVGEIKSLAIQNKWGNRKLAQLEVLLNQFAIADINVEAIVEKYAEIDAFSQGKLPYKPSSFTARNMGKNDLWIAATAYVLNAQLLTTDKDFDHLKDEFLNFERIELPH